MTKYEQKVRERAEEFAQLDYPEAFKDRPCYDPVDAFYQLDKDAVIEQYKGMARLSLQREAEAYRAGYFLARLKTEFTLQQCENQLKKLGLVP